jgi:hypothetical protein
MATTLPHHRRGSVCSLTILFLAALASAPAQNPQPPAAQPSPPLLRITVTMIQVDAGVTNPGLYLPPTPRPIPKAMPRLLSARPLPLPPARYAAP